MDNQFKALIRVCEAVNFLITPGVRKKTIDEKYILSNMPDGYEKELWLRMNYRPIKERVLIAQLLLASELKPSKNLLDLL